MKDRDVRCVVCDAEMVYEAPPRGAGHNDCSELVCTRCGAAEILAPLEIRVLLSPGGNRIAPLQRSSAA